MVEASQCSVSCGGGGRQRVRARCEDAMSRAVVEPGLCNNQRKPSDGWRECGLETCTDYDRSGLWGPLAGVNILFGIFEM